MGGFDEVTAAHTFGEYVLGAGSDDILELSADRERIFNPGVLHFGWNSAACRSGPLRCAAIRHSGRRSETIIPICHDLIDEFNGRQGVRAS
jgi:hypothetical protein